VTAVGAWNEPSHERRLGAARDQSIPGLQAIVAVLPDGTPCYAPIGTMVVDGPRVQCHLCGGWFRSVGAHLSVHGWDRQSYRQAFGLEFGQSLEGTDTRHRRARALRARRASDPIVRAGCEIGQEWVRSGALTRAAAQAARGRRQPEQRRRKTLHTLAGISPAARAEGLRRHSQERLRRTATEAAARLGHPDLGSLVRERIGRGESLAQISREAGLHKDWLSRHLASVDPGTAADIAEAVTGPRPLRRDARWLRLAGELGFSDVRSYLVDRHLVRQQTVRAIAMEVGMSSGAVASALDRHGVPRTAHAQSRGRCHDRAASIANRFGYTDITDYLADRRAAGLTWRAIATECGQPPTWVRRRAGLPN
jgi:lambda repressor-like predicted transcriptional regulator